MESKTNKILSQINMSPDQWEDRCSKTERLPHRTIDAVRECYGNRWGRLGQGRSDGWKACGNGFLRGEAFELGPET